MNAYSVQGAVLGDGDQVESKLHWVFLLLELNIVVRARNREKKHANKPKTKIMSDRHDDKN